MLCLPCSGIMGSTAEPNPDKTQTPPILRAWLDRHQEEIYKEVKALYKAKQSHITTIEGIEKIVQEIKKLYVGKCLYETEWQCGMAFVVMIASLVFLMVKIKEFMVKIKEYFKNKNSFSKKSLAIGLFLMLLTFICCFEIMRKKLAYREIEKYLKEMPSAALDPIEHLIVAYLAIEDNLSSKEREACLQDLQLAAGGEEAHMRNADRNIAHAAVLQNFPACYKHIDEAALAIDDPLAMSLLAHLPGLVAPLPHQAQITYKIPYITLNPSQTPEEVGLWLRQLLDKKKVHVATMPLVQDPAALLDWPRLANPWAQHGGIPNKRILLVVPLPKVIDDAFRTKLVHTLQALRQGEGYRGVADFVFVSTVSLTDAALDKRLVLVGTFPKS